MILIEITSRSSEEFWLGIPDSKQWELMSYLNEASSLTFGMHQFVRMNCLELFRMKFIIGGFAPLEPEELLMDFDEYCLYKRSECRRLMEVGFLEDMREFIMKFLESE